MPIRDMMIQHTNNIINTYGPGHEYTTAEIKNALLEMGIPNGSVKPSDYCYNRFNVTIQDRNGNIDFQYPMLFEYIARGTYRCWGLNCDQVFEVFWKPKGRPELVVGIFENSERRIDWDLVDIHLNR